MCRVYNTIGSLTVVKSKLENNNIRDFKSLRDVIEFQGSYALRKQNLISHHQDLIEQEKANLEKDLQELEISIKWHRQETEQRLTDEINDLNQELNNLLATIPTNIFQKLRSSIRHWKYRKKIKLKHDKFESDVNMSISELVNTYQIKYDRYQILSHNVEEAIRQSVEFPLSELERKKVAIDELNSFIYGALGEQKVVKTLESLSDEYYLVNDFSVYFSPAIYNRLDNEYIKSIQIDHILVGPSGIFLIETKNWSEKSLENISLRSPVKQIKRTSLALFKLLNSEVNKYHLGLGKHHWGEKKISIKNLIVLTNTRPTEEFQYVKILTVSELLGYVNYFKPSLVSGEIQRIAEFLVDINNKKTISIK